jgi:hypothetical protein
MHQTILRVGFICLLCSSCSKHGGEPSKSVAELDILAIGTAIQSYHSAYGRWPVLDTNSEEQNSADMIAMLSLSKTNAQPSTNITQFLNISSNRLVNGRLLDPWGNEYHISLDIKRAGKIKVGNQFVPQPYAIWSNGKNKLNEYGLGDDISSWHEVH